MIGPVGPLPLPVEAVPHETQTLTAHVVASDPIFLESVPSTTMEFTSESTVVGGINTVAASEAIIVEPTTLSATLGVAAQAEAMLPGSVAMDFIEMPDTVDGGVAVAEPVRARLSTMLPGTAGAVTEHVPAGVAIRGGHLVSGGL